MRTTGSRIRGHAELRTTAPPMYTIVRPTYMGFRVKRYGPLATSWLAAWCGITAVRARRKVTIPHAARPTPTIRMPNPIRASATPPPDNGSPRPRRSTNQPIRKPTAKMNGGGKRTPGLESGVRAVTLCLIVRMWTDSGRARNTHSVAGKYHGPTSRSRACRALPSFPARGSYWSRPTLSLVSAKDKHQPTSLGRRFPSPVRLHSSSPPLANHVQQTHRSLRTPPRWRVLDGARAQNHSHSPAQRTGTVRRQHQGGGRLGPRGRKRSSAATPVQPRDHARRKNPPRHVRRPQGER